MQLITLINEQRREHKNKMVKENKNTYKTNRYPYVGREESHSHFGGYIYPSDYDIGGCKKSSVASDSSWARRIASDWRFDASCSAGEINRFIIKYKNKEDTNNAEI